MALGVPLRADALALWPRGARSSPPRHQPVCLGDPGADLLIFCHSAVTGRHRRRRAAREARRPCGSGAGMPCSSSREVRLVGHRKPMPSAVVRWKEMACSSSSVSERVLLSLFSVRDLMLEAISTITLLSRLGRKSIGSDRVFYGPKKSWTTP